MGKITTFAILIAIFLALNIVLSTNLCRIDSGEVRFHKR
jgi:hypothetical protein